MVLKLHMLLSYTSLAEFSVILAFCKVQLTFGIAKLCSLSGIAVCATIIDQEIDTGESLRTEPESSRIDCSFNNEWIAMKCCKRL